MGNAGGDGAAPGERDGPGTGNRETDAEISASVSRFPVPASGVVAAPARRSGRVSA